MEEIKQGWKKRISWLLIAIIVVIVYKILDNFTGVQVWLSTFFELLKPFLIGLLISYILFIPCKKIENSYQKSKVKFISKKSRGLGVVTTYIMFILIVIILVTYLVPILKNSVVDLIGNIPYYYDSIVEKYSNLPDDSILKSEIIKEQVDVLEDLDIKQFFSFNNDKILSYISSIINVFSGIFDIFVAIVVSVYILLQRDAIVKSLRRFARAVLKKGRYETFDKYFTKANEVFFTFLTSQLFDAFLVGVIVTIAMLILRVKYAPLLGFLIGLFNMIPYIGAIIAVAIAVIITLITGGFAQTLIMFIIVLVLQQIDANIINPKILKGTLNTNPLLTLFSISIGGAYFGVLGMFLAVPIAVVIKAILIDYVDAKNKIRDEEEKDAED